MTMEPRTKSIVRSIAERWLSENHVEYMIEREGPLCFCAVGTYEHNSGLGSCEYTTQVHGTNTAEALDELVFEIINHDDFVGIPPITNFSSKGLSTLAEKLFNSHMHIAQMADEIGLDLFHRWVDMREVEVALAQIGIRQCQSCGLWTSTKQIVEHDGICHQCSGELLE